MSTLTVHSGEAMIRDADQLLETASKDGDDLTAPAGVMVYVRSKLKRAGRTVTMTVDSGPEFSVSVRPGQSMIVGPFGTGPGLLDGLDRIISLRMSYPRTRGLRIAAFRPPVPTI